MHQIELVFPYKLRSTYIYPIYYFILKYFIGAISKSQVQSFKKYFT